MENKTQNGAPKFKSVAELRAQYESEASSAKERIKSLFDEGTFVEIGTFAHSAAAEPRAPRASLKASSAVTARSTVDSCLPSHRITRE